MTTNRPMGQPGMTKSEDTTALIAHDEEAFLEALAAIPTGYSEGDFNGRRWGATIKRSPDLKRIWLFAEDLGQRYRQFQSLWAGRRAARAEAMRDVI